MIRTRETETREEIETYHDRIREAVVAGLSPEELKAHHHRLALALETSGQADPEWLAMHWKGAEDLDRAAEYAATAARRASETLAFDRAARLYLLALELPDEDRTRRRAARCRPVLEMLWPTPAAARKPPAPTCRRRGEREGPRLSSFSVAPPSSFS